MSNQITRTVLTMLPPLLRVLLRIAPRYPDVKWITPAGAGRHPFVRTRPSSGRGQVSVCFESDERTREVLRRLLAEGAVMPSGSTWRGHAVIRFSVSSWRTGPAEVAETVAAVERAAAGTPRDP
jgi:hypothetical protein